MLIFSSFFKFYITISKLMDLVCQVSSLVYVSRNFRLIVFKHTLTNSISSLCLVVVVVIFPSCCITIVFIFSTTRISMLLVLLQSINAPFIWSSGTLAFFSSYWVSWSSWSNCLWILNYLFPIPISELQNLKDQCVFNTFSFIQNYTLQTFHF